MERVVEQSFEQTKNFCSSVKTGPWNPGSNRQIIRRNETTQKVTFSIEKLMNTERTECSVQNFIQAKLFSI